MRMHGSWHLYRPGERWQRSPRAARIRIDTDAWVAVAFDVPVAEFVREADLPRHRPLTMLGPDLADPAYDRADALARVAASGDRPIGEVLLDQRVVAGIGNVLRSETLFVAGVHPETPAAQLSAGDVVRLLDTAAALVQRNARTDAYPTRNTTGRRAPGEALWVYQRTGQRCRRCGSLVRSSARGLDARRVVPVPGLPDAASCLSSAWRSYSTIVLKPPYSMRFGSNGMSFEAADASIAFISRITFALTRSRCARDLNTM